MFNVYTVQPAPALVAGWLQRLLSPVNEILKSQPFPIELRPLGAWGGLSTGITLLNRDGRIQISNKMVFRSKAQLVHLYVHELAHNLLQVANPEFDHQHDAAFFCLNAVLLQRLDSAGYSCGYPIDHFSSLSLYDLQDPIAAWSEEPSAIWRPREIGWALSLAEKYSGSDLTALEIAGLIGKEYLCWSEEMATLPAKLKAQKEAARNREVRRQAQIEQLQESHQLRGWLALLFGVGFVSLAVTSLF